VMRRMLKLNLVLGAVAGGLAGVCLALGYYIESLSLVIVFLNCCAAPFFWKRAFQVGWIKGRHAMLDSMAEATRRHMSLPDWITAEMERDGFVVLHEEVED
jgi:hypothetical protein